MPVKVTGVSARGAAPDLVYTLRFRRGDALTGQHPPATDFAVDVTKDAAGYAVVRTLEPKLVGMTFLACVKAFPTTAGEPTVHFHLFPDTPKVRRAVADAVAVSSSDAGRAAPPLARRRVLC